MTGYDAGEIASTKDMPLPVHIEENIKLNGKRLDTGFQ
jgi:hypothetical protein